MGRARTSRAARSASGKLPFIAEAVEGRGFPPLRQKKSQGWGTDLVLSELKIVPENKFEEKRG
jgi:hypothetical protein